MKILGREEITREWVKDKFSRKQDKVRPGEITLFEDFTGDFHKCAHSTITKNKECHAFPRRLEDHYCIPIHLDSIPRLKFIYKWMCWARYMKASKILVIDQYHLLYEAMKIFGYKYKDSSKDFRYIELVKKINQEVLTNCDLYTTYLRQKEKEKTKTNLGAWLNYFLAKEDMRSNAKG